MRGSVIVTCCQQVLPAAALDKAVMLVARVRKELGSVLAKVPWMDKSAHEAAALKLSNMVAAAITI